MIKLNLKKFNPCGKQYQDGYGEYHTCGKSDIFKDYPLCNNCINKYNVWEKLLLKKMRV